MKEKKIQAMSNELYRQKQEIIRKAEQLDKIDPTYRPRFTFKIKN